MGLRRGAFQGNKTYEQIVPIVHLFVLWCCPSQMGRALRIHPGKRRAAILDHVGNVYRHGLPDDEREWSLAGREKRPAAASDAMPVRQCGECYHVHRPAPACPRCGFQYPVQSREIEEVAGELEQVDVVAIRAKQKDEIRKARTLEELEAIGRARGFKPGWAWFTFNSKQAARRAYNTGQRRKA
jgi:hypothetical protein